MAKLQGRYRITEMDMWDHDFIDEEVPGFIEFKAKGVGQFHFGYVRCDIDWRSDEEDRAEFSFQRFLSAFDMLAEQVRWSTGELVRKVDPNALEELVAELDAKSRVRRLRALQASPMIDGNHVLAPRIIELIRDVIVDINRQGTGVLLIEQNAQMALSIADHAYVLETGRVVLEGPAAELREDDDVREFYLGVGGEGHKSYREVKHYRRRKRWLS